MSEVELDARNDNGLLTIRLFNGIDTAYARALEPLLMAELDVEYTRLVLDLAGVTFISSSGLRVLLKLGKKAEKRKAMLELHNLNEVVATVMKISDFDKIFNIK